MSATKGRCPQCNARVMLRDDSGLWFTKRNFQQVDFIYSDKSRVRLYMCSNCALNPDKQFVIDNITSEISQSSNEIVKNQIKQKGYPEGFEIVRK